MPFVEGVLSEDELAEAQRHFLALDGDDYTKSISFAAELGPYIGGVSPGIELTNRVGWKDVVPRMRRAAKAVCLNIKLNDSVTNTQHFIEEARDYGPDIVTVRISEYDAPLRAAIEHSPGHTAIAGFTIDDDEAAYLGKIESAKKMKRLSRIAIDAGARILMGPGYFAEQMREAAEDAGDGSKVLVVATNIRLPEDNVDEHPFPVRPVEARRYADLLLIGRPYKLAPEPLEALKRYINDGR